MGSVKGERQAESSPSTGPILRELRAAPTGKPGMKRMSFADHSLWGEGSSGTSMQIQEAKSFVEHQVSLEWADRKGEIHRDVVDVYEVNFVPLYGPCMITSAGEIRLDRIQGCQLFEATRIAS